MTTTGRITRSRTAAAAAASAASAATNENSIAAASDGAKSVAAKPPPPSSRDGGGGGGGKPRARPTAVAAAAATKAAATTKKPAAKKPAAKRTKKTAAAASAPKKRAATAKAPPPTEKRAKKYRSSCPEKLRDRIDRALSQRLYLVRQEPDADRLVAGEDGEGGEPTPSCEFVVLGSTGNVYTVTLGDVPRCTCPDHVRRREQCKHIFFVVLRVIGVPPEDPLSYQSAYLRSELGDLWGRLKTRRASGGLGGQMANERVRDRYNNLSTPDAEKGGEEDDGGGGVRRQSMEDAECPICFEDFVAKKESTTYCKGSCGANFHRDCIKRWVQMQRGSSGPTCPNCRQPWIGDGSSANNKGGGKDKKEEGYVNLGSLQGQSPVRDTSTYYRGRYQRPYR